MIFEAILSVLVTFLYLAKASEDLGWDSTQSFHRSFLFRHVTSFALAYMTISKFIPRYRTCIALLITVVYQLIVFVEGQVISTHAVGATSAGSEALGDF